MNIINTTRRLMEKANQQKNQFVAKEKQAIDMENDMLIRYAELAKRQAEIKELEDLNYKKKMNQEITDTYKHQMEIRNHEKESQKKMDRMYIEMEKNQLEKEEDNRRKFFEKIRGGYAQNHNVMNEYKKLYAE